MRSVKDTNVELRELLKLNVIISYVGKCFSCSSQEVHTGWNGSSANGEEPVQRKTDGAARGC